MKIRIVSPDRQKERVVRVFGREPGLNEEIHVIWHTEEDDKLNVHGFEGIVERVIWTMGEEPRDVRCSVLLKNIPAN